MAWSRKCSAGVAHQLKLSRLRQDHSRLPGSIRLLEVHNGLPAMMRAGAVAGAVVSSAVAGVAWGLKRFCQGPTDERLIRCQVAVCELQLVAVAQEKARATSSGCGESDSAADAEATNANDAGEIPGALWLRHHFKRITEGAGTWRTNLTIHRPIPASRRR